MITAISYNNNNSITNNTYYNGANFNSKIFYFHHEDGKTKWANGTKYV